MNDYITVQAYSLRSYHPPIITTEVIVLPVPSNVTDPTLFKYAMTAVQLNILESNILRRLFKIESEIDASVSDAKLDRLYRQIRELREAYDIVQGIYSEELNGNIINTDRTIAELMAYVVFPVCKGTPKKPRMLDGSSMVYDAAQKVCNNMSEKNLAYFRSVAKDFMAYHTSRDMESGFAKQFRHRLSRDKAIALLGYTCPRLRYDSNKKCIIEEQIDPRELITQLILACLKKNYKL